MTLVVKIGPIHIIKISLFLYSLKSLIIFFTYQQHDNTDPFVTSASSSNENILQYLKIQKIKYQFSTKFQMERKKGQGAAKIVRIMEIYSNSRGSTCTTY